MQHYLSFLIPLALALITTWAIQYFILSRWSASSTAQTTVVKEHKPLNMEVDFIDADLDATPAVITEVETDGALMRFSTHAASLDSMVFKRQADGIQTTIQALLPVGPEQRGHHCFLVALEQ